MGQLIIPYDQITNRFIKYWSNIFGKSDQINGMKGRPKVAKKF